MPSRKLHPCKEAPSTMGAFQTCATTDEIAKQNKLAETAAGGFLIQQSGLCNLESTIQLRSRTFYLKDGIFLKVLM